jgi:hypothetical protein
MSRRELRRIAAATESLAETPPTRNTAIEPTTPERIPLRYRLFLKFGGGAHAEQLLRERLAEFSILICVGPNGGGKTLCAVVLARTVRDGERWECDQPDHAHTKRGVTSGYRRILSTVPILDTTGTGYRPVPGSPGAFFHPLYDEFNDYRQLVDVEHSLIVMDEVSTVASSRDSARMDPRVEVKLQQLRKSDCSLIATAPSLARMDKLLREVCRCIIECRGFAPEPYRGSGSRIWRPKQVFHFAAYDSTEFEEWTAGRKEKSRPLRAVWFKGARCEAFRAYDTLGSVSVLASMTPQDTCTVCDGKVTRHYCQCNKPSRDRRSSSRSSTVLTSASDATLTPLTTPGAPTVRESVDAPA